MAIPRQFLPLIFLVFVLFIAPPSSQATGIPQLQVGAANITISRFSTPRTIGVSAPLTMFVELQNNGGLASGNITLNAKIKSVSKSFSYEYDTDPLSPNQNESLAILAFNNTPVTGNYIVTINASYTANGYAHTSKSLSSGYSVVQTQNQIPPNSTFAIRTKRLAITYAPLYAALSTGQEEVSDIGMENLGLSPEFVNISISNNYTRFIKLSANSIFLKPNDTLYVQFVLNATANNADTASYGIPVTFSINPINGNRTTITEKMEFTISNSIYGQPIILNDVTLTNSTNSTTGIVEIYGAANRSISNATLIALLPANVAANVSDIKTYGLQSNVSLVNGKYRMQWQVQSLPAGQVVYAYYRIDNIRNLQFPSDIQDILTIPSVLRPSSMLRVVNFSLPTLYVNSTANISAEVLYTGTMEQEVYFYLTAPLGIGVRNSTQYVNATPNELIKRRFTITTGKDSGTLLFTLYIDTNGANITYSLPVVVLCPSCGPPSTKPQTSTITSASSINLPTNYSTLLVIAIPVLLIVLLIYVVMVLANRPKYDSNRAEKLANIKEQMKRQGGDGG